jgi:demethylmenaquinone methyltransferase / 2-methoxy-6-polyprenyl-1,4-benzoquinol methylase
LIAAWLARVYFWACERLYYQLAAYYDMISWGVSAGQWRCWQRGVWELVDATEVLELGCGTAAMLVEGGLRGKKMVGVDLSPAMLAVGAHRLNIARSDAKSVRGDGELLPFTDGAFEAVMATFPAGYILAQATLDEVYRVLRANGRFVALGIWVELHAGLLARLMPLFYSRPSEPRLQRIAQKVEASGFVAQWVRQRHGIFTVGVLVAEKCGRGVD